MKVQFPLIFIFLFVFNCGGSETYTVEEKDGVRYVHNFSPKWRDEERITLQFIQQIGGSDTTGENYLFFKPLSAALDDEGNVFISDVGENHVKKFTHDGKYLTTIGSQGHGPGEFSGDSPMSLHVNGNILICTDQSRVFHKFTTDGEFIESFRPDFFISSFLLLKDEKIVFGKLGYEIFDDQEPKLIQLVDFNGKLFANFCTPSIYENNKAKSFAFNGLVFAKDSNDNILVTFRKQNRIEKFTRRGKQLWSADRPLEVELKHELVHRELRVNGRTIKYPSHEFTSASSGIGVDSKNRIWILTYTKVYEEGDRMKDRLVYEVFESDGVLLTRVPLPDHRFDNIVQAGDRLFFMDPFETASVFEYKIVER